MKSKRALNITKLGNELLIDDFPVLSMPDKGKDLKYFSINPFLPDKTNRCPLDCQYCICHKDDRWHHHPEKYLTQPEEEWLVPCLVEEILQSEEGKKGLPISLCDYSDPFLHTHLQHVLQILSTLKKKRAKNLIYITTKVNPGQRYLLEFAKLIKSFKYLKITVFVSLAPLVKGIEPVSIPQRVSLIQSLVELGIPCCWYLRPLHEMWYDEKLLFDLAEQVLPLVKENVLLSGLTMSQEIEEILVKHRLPVPSWERVKRVEKIPLSSVLEAHIRSVLASVANKLKIDIGPVMGHRLCGANGHHNYVCQHCDKNDRFCQYFKQTKFGQLKPIQIKKL